MGLQSHIYLQEFKFVLYNAQSFNKGNKIKTYTVLSKDPFQPQALCNLKLIWTLQIRGFVLSFWSRSTPIKNRFSPANKPISPTVENISWSPHGAYRYSHSRSSLAGPNVGPSLLLLMELFWYRRTELFCCNTKWPQSLQPFQLRLVEPFSFKPRWVRFRVDSSFINRAVSNTEFYCKAQCHRVWGEGRERVLLEQALNFVAEKYIVISIFFWLVVGNYRHRTATTLCAINQR